MAEKLRKCVNCGKKIPEKEGVKLLRGMSFACKDCYRKEKQKQNKKKTEVCEFC